MCVCVCINMCAYMYMCVRDKERDMAFRSDLIFGLGISSWIRTIDGTEKTFNKRITSKN